MSEDPDWVEISDKLLVRKKPDALGRVMLEATDFDSSMTFTLNATQVRELKRLLDRALGERA